MISLDVFDIESIEDGSRPENRICLFDIANNEVLIDTCYTPDTGGDNLWDQVMFNSAVHPQLKNIGRIDVYFGGSGALVDLVYNVVPLPAAFWLFSTAPIGFIGFSRRTSA